MISNKLQLLCRICIISMLGPNPLRADSKEWLGWCNNQFVQFTREQQIVGCTELIKQGVLKQKQLALVFYNRGIANYRLGRLAEAISDYTASINMGNRDSSVYRNRGLVQLGAKLYDKSIEDFTQAISLGDTGSEVYLNRGDARESKGDREGALVDYDEAIRLNPNMPRARLARGLLFFHARNYQQAAQAFEGLFALSRPENELHFAFVFYGISLMQMGQFANAVMAFDEAILRAPDNPDAWQSRGTAKLMLADDAGAISDFTEAARLMPQAIEPVLSLGIAYLRQRRWFEAAAAYNSARAKDGTNAAAIYGLGFAKQKLGKHSDGVTEMQQALKMQPRISDEFAAFGVN